MRDSGNIGYAKQRQPGREDAWSDVDDTFLICNTNHTSILMVYLLLALNSKSYLE